MFKRAVFAFFLLPGSFLFSQDVKNQDLENKAAKRIYAHLQLNDTASAAYEAEDFLQKMPHSKPLYLALIRTLAIRGEEMKALEKYEKAKELFEELKDDCSLIEEIAWGILQKGQSSPQFPIKTSSLLGATFTRDARALPLILANLRDSNAYMRALSAKLCTLLGDDVLKEELLALLPKEKVWYVRLEMIQALGAMQEKKALHVLQEIVASPQTLAEERASAIIAIASLYDKIEQSEVETLAKSSRAGLRELSCQLIMHFELEECIPLLIGLTKDPSPDVRMAALGGLGFLRVQKYQGENVWKKVEASLQDHDPYVVITACWLSIILHEKEGLKILQEKIEGPIAEERRVASAALAITGKVGQELSSKMLRKSQDPYVKANLAIGLFGQRVDTKLSTSILFDLFIQEKETLWMWENSPNPLFRSLAPSKLRHIDQIPYYPVVVDQFVRLELLSMLSIMEHPKAELAVKQFLKQRTWGVSSSAASLLLQEGGEESFDFIKNLLEDKDENIRVQAALVLAIVGNEYSAIEVLKKAYPNADRELKVHILEAIAHVGDTSCVPFLTQILSEPFYMLRVIAACAIIQCLHH